MRIVLDLQGLQASSGPRGIGRYAQEFTRGLVSERGDHQIILLLNGAFPESIIALRREYLAELGEEGFAVWTPPDRIPGLDRSRDELRYAAELICAERISQLAPDVVHVFSPFEGYVDDAVFGLPAPDRAYCETVSVHDLIPLEDQSSYLDQDPYYRRFYQRQLTHLKAADGYLTNSDRTRQAVLQTLSEEHSVVRAVGTGVTQSFVKSRDSQGSQTKLAEDLGISQPYLLYFGGYDTRKNVEHLLASFAALELQLRENYCLVLAGQITVDQKDRLLPVIERLGVESRVFFTGYLSDEELAALSARCSLFVFPSLSEGFGMPVLEAMACGAPVIGSNVTSIPEVIGLPEALFDPNNVVATAELMAAALNDEAFRKTLVCNAKERVEKFTWKSVAHRAFEAWRSLRQEADPLGRADSNHEQPRLHIVGSLVPHRGSILGPPVALANSLATYYDVRFISPNELGGGNVSAEMEVRNIDWFRENAKFEDRVLYLLGDSQNDAFIFELMRVIPGVVALESVFLGEIFESLENRPFEQGVWGRHIYQAHGFEALRMRYLDPENAKQAYPTSFEAVQLARGLLVKSENDASLLHEWFGEMSNPLVVVGKPPKSPGDQSKKRRVGSPILGEYPHELFDAIEQFRSMNLDPVGRVVEKLCQRESPITETIIEPSRCLRRDRFKIEEVVNSISFALAQTFPRKIPQRRLFLDVTSTRELDVRTGVQRVAKAILLSLLNSPPSDWRIEPVYLGQAGNRWDYYFARSYAALLADIPDSGMEDEFVEFAPGDAVVTLDLSGPAFLNANSAGLFKRLQSRGITMHAVAFDLLPITMPEVFPQGASSVHTDWLEVVCSFDSIAAISQTVADEITGWMDCRKMDSQSRTRVTAFPLGADFHEPTFVEELSQAERRLLDGLGDRPTFLMVGTIEPRKGYDQALAAFDLLWRNGVDTNLVIVGKPGWSDLSDHDRKTIPEIERVLRTHPEVGKRLHWLGQASDSMLESLYLVADCLLAASYDEGFGLPLIEAAQRQLPILARDIPIFREVAGHHATYFSSGIAANLAGSIQEWLDQDTRGLTIKSAGMPFASWRESANCLAREISAVVSTQGPGHSRGSGAMDVRERLN